MTTRGCRNNNPGNIRLRPGLVWLGQVSPERQTDPEFVQFESMFWGLRAMCRILRTYRERHGLRTIRQMITRWAPPRENDTDGYVRFVAARAGVDPDRPLDPERDRDALLSMVRAMVTMESGHACAEQIDDGLIERAAVAGGLVPPRPGAASVEPEDVVDAPPEPPPAARGDGWSDRLVGLLRSILRALRVPGT